MKSMKLHEIRQQFLEYFESKNHKIVSSAPMVIKNDPTLMFTNAGMNQFKDYFLGHAEAKDKRVTDTQKCLRVSGKHNDLEEVGVDTYHHTMFEMLGNWSFGDYFKEEAIAWAWELLTDIYKIDISRLYVTVFEGDEEDGVPIDTESIEIWKKYIHPDRIILANKKDNFWEMGDTGPCGPCTEIHVDARTDSERAKIDGKTLVNQDHPQVIEIWNNVFMEFNRLANGKLVELPAKHVDTGMGLERLAMVLQGKQSNYDTDLFQNLIKHLEKVSGFSYGKKEETDIALRVIADHVRAIAFSIADGQLPSNTGAGYVIRRILRRAVRYGYQILDLKESFISDLAGVLADEMGDAFPELKAQLSLIQNVIREEENSFFRTLEQGIKRINTILTDLKSTNQQTISGDAVFELYDTFGFPIDLTSLIARENGFSIDEAGFNAALEEQKQRSRAASTLETDDWVEIRKDEILNFVGYDQLETSLYITKYRKVTQKQKTFYQLVFNTTPFYAEGGGQVGDKGQIVSGDDCVTIFDTKKENNLTVHLADRLPKDPFADFIARVDVTKRELSASNHSATHLLHHALREVLGTHVEQKGSLVTPDYLRFDFSHFSKMTDEELEKVEQLVSEAIQRNISLEEKRNTSMDTAKEMGAMALFGEKYGDSVRVIKFGDSVELCGGTHVSSTGKIGLFKLVSESAIAAGVRRIEAITNQTAIEFYKNKAIKLDSVSQLLKQPKDIEKAVEDLLSKNQQLTKLVEQFEREQAKQFKSVLKNEFEDRGEMLFVSRKVAMGANNIKDILFQLKGELEKPFIAVIGGEEDGKASLSIMISDELVHSKGYNAGTLIRENAKFIQGGGGGQPFFATAGGKNPNGIDEALKSIAAQL
jgi:alanyl-tRNA synthetase